MSLSRIRFWVLVFEYRTSASRLYELVLHCDELNACSKGVGRCMNWTRSAVYSGEGNDNAHGGLSYDVHWVTIRYLFTMCASNFWEMNQNTKLSTSWKSDSEGCVANMHVWRHAERHVTCVAQPPFRCCDWYQKASWPAIVMNTQVLSLPSLDEAKCALVIFHRIIALHLFRRIHVRPRDKAFSIPQYPPSN